MVKILILICSVNLTPADCTSNTALDVIGAGSAQTAIACLMYGENLVASTDLSEQAFYLKITCDGDPPRFPL